MSRLRKDDRLSMGGASAAAHMGAELAAGESLEAYLRENDLESVVGTYRLRADPDGQVILRVVPDRVPEPLSPPPRTPVAPVVAALDLLESPDARSKALARSWLNDIGDLMTGHVDHSDDDRDPAQAR